LDQFIEFKLLDVAQLMLQLNNLFNPSWSYINSQKGYFPWPQKNNSFLACSCDRIVKVTLIYSQWLESTHMNVHKFYLTKSQTTNLNKLIGLHTNHA